MLPQSSVVNTSFKAKSFPSSKKYCVTTLKRELIGIVSPIANRVYCLIEYFCKENLKNGLGFQIFTSAEYLARHLCVSKSSVNDAFVSLKRENLIVENETKEFIAVRDKEAGKSFKLGRSFSSKSINDLQVFSEEPTEEKKNLATYDQKLAEIDLKLVESDQKLVEESSETVTKPSVSDGSNNKDNKYKKNTNSREDFEKIYDKFPKRDFKEHVTSALLEKFEEAKTELGLEKLQEHVEAYAEERAKAIRKDASESRYTSKFYTWLTERKWERIEQEEVSQSKKIKEEVSWRPKTITEEEIDSLDECQKAKDLRKKFMKEQGENEYASLFASLKFSLSSDGSIVFSAPDNFHGQWLLRRFSEYFEGVKFEAQNEIE